MGKTLTATRTGAGSRSRSRKQQEQEQEAAGGRGIESMEFYFDHEKLEVYRIAIQFVA